MNHLEAMALSTIWGSGSGKHWLRSHPKAKPVHRERRHVRYYCSGSFAHTARLTASHTARLLREAPTCSFWGVLVDSNAAPGSTEANAKVLQEIMDMRGHGRAEIEAKVTDLRRKLTAEMERTKVVALELLGPFHPQTSLRTALLSAGLQRMSLSMIGAVRCRPAWRTIYAFAGRSRLGSGTPDAAALFGSGEVKPLVLAQERPPRRVSGRNLLARLLCSLFDVCPGRSVCCPSAPRSLRSRCSPCTRRRGRVSPRCQPSTDRVGWAASRSCCR